MPMAVGKPPLSIYNRNPVCQVFVADFPKCVAESDVLGASGATPGVSRVTTTEQQGVVQVSWRYTLNCVPANTEPDERVANLRLQFACVLVDARPSHSRPELLPAGGSRRPLARMTSLRRTSGQWDHAGPTCLERLKQVSTHLGDRSFSCRWRSRFVGVMPDLGV
jgi:hypothetical protein